MVGPDSHNKEEQRFVEALSRRFQSTVYLRGAGIKGLRIHQLRSLRGRLSDHLRSDRELHLRRGSLMVLPFRRAARHLNAAWVQQQLAGILRNRLHDQVFWIRFPSPELVDAIAHLPSGRVVYEPIDLYSAAEDLSVEQCQRLVEAEQRLVKRAIVVTGGRQLAERFAGAAGGSHWLPFGRDLGQRSDGPGVPFQVDRPRLCLVGCLDWRVDEAVLVSLLAQHPEWQLVLAGPRVHPWGSRLKRLANVHWLGQIPADHVRAVVRDCEVALIPYRLTDWTRHCLPVKVFEYLAEGKPVVATPLPELTLFGDVVTGAPANRFADAVELAIRSDTQSERERRQRAADRYTLQWRAEKAAELLERVPVSSLCPA